MDFLLLSLPCLCYLRLLYQEHFVLEESPRTMPEYPQERIVMVGGKMYPPFTSEAAQLAFRVTDARARAQAVAVVLAVITVVGGVLIGFEQSWRSVCFSSLASGLILLAYWTWQFRLLRAELTAREQSEPESFR